MDLSSTIRICLQIAIKNTIQISKVVTYELFDQEYDPTRDVISSEIVVGLNDTPSIEVSLTTVLKNGTKQKNYNKTIFYFLLLITMKYYQLLRPTSTY